MIFRSINTILIIPDIEPSGFIKLNVSSYVEARCLYFDCYIVSWKYLFMLYCIFFAYEKTYPRDILGFITDELHYANDNWYDQSTN